MAKKKVNKQSESAKGNTNALKTGTGNKGVVNKLLTNNGIDFNKLVPKMEQYESILEWNTDSMAYMAAKAKVMKEYIELAHTLGGKGLEIQDEITRLSMLLNKMEKDYLEDGRNPLESKEYQSALKLKKDYLIEKSKLNLDAEKAKVDYVIKKNKGELGDDDMFTVMEE